MVQLSGQGRLEHLFTPYVHLRLKLFEAYYNSNEDRIECVNGTYNTQNRDSRDE